MPKKEAELIQKIAQSIRDAKSSILAGEKWLEKLSQKLNVNIAPDNLQEIRENQEQIMTQNAEKVVEGAFDGQNMVDSKGSIYPIPMNYASKSKLVQGDRLKLTIAGNGAFIFKQIELIPRKLKVGFLVMDNSQYQVLCDSKTYNVLYASVTFFQAKVGDKVTIILPAECPSQWAAIENIITRNDNSMAPNEDSIDEVMA